MTCTDVVPRVWMKKSSVGCGVYRGAMPSMPPVPAPDELPYESIPAQAVELDRAQVEVRRSTRRRRTVSAYKEGDRTIVLLPARMSRHEEEQWVATMLERLEAQERRSKPSDDELWLRAQRLSTRYLDGRAHPRSVRWVSNQRTRWGSCTPADGAIRLSDRLQGMPEWVVDYVVLHELAHLVVHGHGPEFWALLEAYPEVERARGFLDGWSLALQHAGVKG
jgi:predicted metal-dependent hydrolase